MEHVAKGGKHKILKSCELPLTGVGCVSQIITDLVSDSRAPISSLIRPTLTRSVQCVFEIDREGGKMTLTELAPGVSLEEVRSKTGADYEVASSVKTMDE